MYEALLRDVRIADLDMEGFPANDEENLYKSPHHGYIVSGVLVKNPLTVKSFTSFDPMIHPSEDYLGMIELWLYANECIDYYNMSATERMWVHRIEVDR